MKKLDMSKDEAQKLINEVFDGIKKSTSCQNIQALLSHRSIPDSCKMDLKKYPKIEFTVSLREIENLIDKGVLDKEFELTNQATTHLDSLSKLLYAIIWKNGDLKKVKSIVQGVRNAGQTADDEENAVVFRQFGKFLNRRDEPIVDQHVIRAFALYCDKSKDFEKLRSIGVLNKSHQSYIDDYKYWLKSDKIQDELKKVPEYTYHIDQLLFAVGKTVKIGKTSKNS